MRSLNLEFVLAQARHPERTDAFGAAVAQSIEVGVVVPSILRAHLAEAGYTVAQDEATASQYGFNSLAVLKRVLITDSEGQLVAMGAAGDYDEALLHAALGYFRENRLGDEEAPEGIAEVPAPAE